VIFVSRIQASAASEAKQVGEQAGEEDFKQGSISDCSFQFLVSSTDKN